MLRLALVTLMALAFVVDASKIGRSTQIAVPDFSGTWKIDRTLSTAKALNYFDDLIFVISQNLPQLKLKRIVKKGSKEKFDELTYYTDGRGEKISFLAGGFGGQKFHSETNLVGTKLVSKFTVTGYISTNADFYYQDVTEIWELSNDGKTLTITTENNFRHVPDFYKRDYEPQTYRKVFHKI